MNQETYDRLRRQRRPRGIEWFLNWCFLIQWLPPVWVVVWVKRIFYLPDTIQHRYRVRKFWRIAVAQRAVERRLEWRLKQTPPKK